MRPRTPPARLNVGNAFTAPSAHVAIDPILPGDEAGISAVERNAGGRGRAIDRGDVGHVGGDKRGLVGREVCGAETDGRSHPAAARKSRSHRCQSAKNCDGDRRNAKRSQSRRNC